MIDSTIARASACGRRPQGQRACAEAQGLGRSRGGLSTEIHVAGDALDLLIRLLGTPGQRNDITAAGDFVDGFEAGAVIADNGCDADTLVEAVAGTGAEVVTPPKRNRNR